MSFDPVSYVLNGVETFMILYLIYDIRDFKRRIEELDERLSYLEGRLNGLEERERKRNK